MSKRRRPYTPKLKFQAVLEVLTGQDEEYNQSTLEINNSNKLSIKTERTI